MRYPPLLPAPPEQLTLTAYKAMGTWHFTVTASSTDGDDWSSITLWSSWTLGDFISASEIEAHMIGTGEALVGDEERRSREASGAPRSGDS